MGGLSGREHSAAALSDAVRVTTGLRTPVRMFLLALLVACVWFILGVASTASASEKDAPSLLGSLAGEPSEVAEQQIVAAAVEVVDSLASAPVAEPVPSVSDLLGSTPVQSVTAPIVEIANAPVVSGTLGVVVRAATVVKDAPNTSGAAITPSVALAPTPTPAAVADDAAMNAIHEGQVSRSSVSVSQLAAPSAPAVSTDPVTQPVPAHPHVARNSGAVSASSTASAGGTAVAMAEERFDFDLAVASRADECDEAHPISPTSKPGSVPD